MPHENLLANATPVPTYLPENETAAAELREGADPKAVAGRFPTHCAAWADLADRTLAEDPVTAYAYARAGYHRGLDQLRRAGWKGYGPVPWEHVPNQGFLRALGALARAAQAIGEDPEYQRCKEFLADADPEAAGVLGVE